jgi:8-oxo-dGTP diphosphatase
MPDDTPPIVGRLYLGAYALCVRDGAVLLARLGPGSRFDSGRWTLPGGGVDFGEAPDEAVLRELREETGLTGDRGPVLGVYSRVNTRSNDRPLPPVHHVGVLYQVTAHDGELVCEADGTTDHCAWVPLAEAGALPLVPLAAYGVGLLVS